MLFQKRRYRHAISAAVSFLGDGIRSPSVVFPIVQSFAVMRLICFGHNPFGRRRKAPPEIYLPVGAERRTTNRSSASEPNTHRLFLARIREASHFRARLFRYVLHGEIQ